jgi:hypothetical protein
MNVSFTVRYSDIQGGYPGTANINSNPMFADSNYILLVSSPCIDRGDSSTVYNDPEDQGNPGNAKFPSRGTLRNDIGAYGGPLSRILTTQLIGITGNNSEIPEQFALYQNYPNPFNPQTKITFDMPQSGYMSLKIFDILGREVRTLTEGLVQAGTHTIDFDASGFSSGVYFYKLTGSDFSFTKKMVLTK